MGMKTYEYIADCKPLICVCREELTNLINSNNIGSSVNGGDIDKLVSIIGYFKNSLILMQAIENNFCNTLERCSSDNLSYNLS